MLGEAPKQGVIFVAMSDVPHDLRSMSLGYSRTALRRKLVDAVLHARKTATSSLRAEYAPYSGESLPQVGERRVLYDFDDRAVAVVETIEVRILSVSEVDLAFARDEGEGFETVGDWRRAHERFWEGHEINDDTLIVAERFKVIKRL